jgi:hypothetical protein
MHERVGINRTDRASPLVSRERLERAAELTQGISEPVEHGGRIGVERPRSFEGGERAFVVSKRHQCIATMKVRFGIVGRARQNKVEAREGFRRAIQVEQHATPVVQGHGMLRRQCQCLVIARKRFFQAAQLAHRVPALIQVIGVIVLTLDGRGCRHSAKPGAKECSKSRAVQPSQSIVSRLVGH